MRASLHFLASPSTDAASEMGSWEERRGENVDDDAEMIETAPPPPAISASSSESEITAGTAEREATQELKGAASVARSCNAFHFLDSSRAFLAKRRFAST